MSEDNRVIRPELNIEQWTIWQPANTKKELLDPKREIKREIELENGACFIAKVTVMQSDYGVLTTEDQKTFYGLTKIWEDAGQPVDRNTLFSVRQLLNVLKIQRSQHAVEGIVKSLLRLRINAIQIDQAFFDATKKSRVTRKKPVTILDDLELIQKEIEGQLIKDKSSFKFNSLILQNLVANHRKPLLLDAVLSLKTDIGLILYSALDRKMTHLDEIKIKSTKIFDDLGLTGEQYRYLSARKRTLSRAIKDINNKPLSSGGFIEAKIEPTKDKKDVNAVFKKQKQSLTPSSQSTLIQELATFGIKDKEARELIANYSEDNIRHQIGAMQFRNKVKSPGAFLLKAIKDDYSLPPEYLNLSERTSSPDPKPVLFEMDSYSQAGQILSKLPEVKIEELRLEAQRIGITSEDQIHQYLLFAIAEEINSGEIPPPSH